MRPICFLSDFGLADDFVGTCKGVMLGIAPGVAVVDLTHEVPGFEIEAGAEILQHATRYMPEDTVYLAVVDPGVGTERRALALRVGSGALLVGPDNGILVPAAEALGGISEAVLLTNGRYHVHPVSNTFHGRDVFSPVAAHLAAGVQLSELGEAAEPSSLARFEPPGVEEVGGGEGVTARIISMDRYGNARLSISQEEWGLEYDATLGVDVGEGDGGTLPGDLRIGQDRRTRARPGLALAVEPRHKQGQCRPCTRAQDRRKGSYYAVGRSRRRWSLSAGI